MHILTPTKLKLAATTTLAAIVIMAALLLHGGAEANSQGGGLTTQVPENSASGISLGTPLQTTAEPGATTYSLSGTDAALFSIDPRTGEIRLAAGATPDFEAKSEYSVTITASAQLTVQVTNVDEPGSVTLSNDSPRTGEPVNATLSDPDAGVENLRWQWQRQEGDHWQDIADANSDDHTPGSGDVGHRLQAVATYDDNAGQGHTAQAATGNPVRNDPPEFGDDTANLAVDENTAPGATVGDPITAADPNGDDVSLLPDRERRSSPSTRRPGRSGCRKEPPWTTRPPPTPSPSGRRTSTGTRTKYP